MSEPTEQLGVIARRYRRFAVVEAAGRSSVYARESSFVAECRPLLEFLGTLPAARQQPNLFLAAARAVIGVPSTNEAFLAGVLERRDEIRRIMLTRTTQTNEPGRCAVLLPILARLQQPLALLEIGAAAGLCLLPDRYGYDYGHGVVGPAGASRPNAPVFPCRLNASVPVPRSMPVVEWRLGVDLNPLDVGSEDDAAWLETLVWPGMEDRAERLRMALAIARSSPPRIVKGDLLRLDLEVLLRDVPSDATLVIYHSAVLGYVPDQADRKQFVDRMRNIDAVWISNEAPGVVPSTIGPAAPRPTVDAFLVSVDGRPVGWSGPHGQYLTWMAD